MLIDKEGTKYRLTKKKLRAASGVPFWVYLTELLTATTQLWIGKEGPEQWVRVRVNQRAHSIGCRKFSKEAFTTIMEAAREAAKSGKTR